MGGVLVIGEALVDRVRAADGTERDLPGGSGANTAVALARLGRTTWLATGFARDEYGDLLARHLAANDVALATDPLTLDHTSSALARIGADGAASYAFDVDWAVGSTLSPSMSPYAVHVTSLAPVLDPGRETVLRLVEDLHDTAMVTYDLNVRASLTGVGAEVVERIEAMVALADVVKASDEDLETLWPDLAVDGAADRLRDLGPSVVVVTRGGAGASYASARGTGRVDSTPVTVADTIGAGDTFSAAMIDALGGLGGLGGREGLGDADWRAVLDWAVRVAAVTVSRAGADPPYRHEVG